MHAFGKRGRPRFKVKNRLHSVEGKGDVVIRLRWQDEKAVVLWDGLVLPLLRDPRDRDGWQKQALSCRTKYVRVLRRSVRGKTLWYAQLVQEGLAPRKERLPVGAGIVGLDLGPSTIAAVSDTDATLEPFCPGVADRDRSIRRLQFPEEFRPEREASRAVPVRRDAEAQGCECRCFGGRVRDADDATVAGQPRHGRVREEAAVPAVACVRRWQPGAARFVLGVVGALCRTGQARRIPMRVALGGCGTAAETGGVGLDPIGERGGLCPSPRPPWQQGWRRSGSSVAEGWPPDRGRGCCSASESRREARRRHLQTPLTLAMGRFSGVLSPGEIVQPDAKAGWSTEQVAASRWLHRPGHHR